MIKNETTTFIKSPTVDVITVGNKTMLNISYAHQGTNTFTIESIVGEQVKYRNRKEWRSARHKIKR